MLHTQTVAPQTLGLIQALQAEPLLKRFHLVGGTALALQIGHRMSVDIDLFTRDDYDVDELLSLFINRYGFQRNYQRGKTLKGFINGMLRFYKTLARGAREGDMLNILFAASTFNMCKLVRSLVLFLRELFLRISAVCQKQNKV